MVLIIRIFFKFSAEKNHCIIKEAYAGQQRKNMEDNEGNLAAGGGQSGDTSGLAVASTSSNNESQPKMFKLNIDCFEHWFEWLSLKELLALRRTCKRLKAVVDVYIKSNYPQVLRLRLFKADHLLAICGSRPNRFEWIKHLQISVVLTDAQIDGMKYVLNGVETLDLDVRSDVRPGFTGDLYEILFQHCPRVKLLSVTTYTSNATLVGSGNEWLLRQYPALEHLQIKIGAPLQHTQPIQCPELLTFFQQNPNVRAFSTDGFFLLMNRDIFRGSNIKLDHFQVRVIRDLPLICNLMNDLHGQEFYKHLGLEVCRTKWIPDQDLQHLWAFPSVHKLELRSLMGDFPVPVVESIKELSFERMWFPFSNIPLMMAANLINLKRVDFVIASLRHVSPFICHSPKLKEIRIWRSIVEQYDDFEPDLSDFVALNDARKKLVRPQKVSIYVDEEFFLEMKWTANVQFDLIELKCIDSCEKDSFYD